MSKVIDVQQKLQTQVDKMCNETDRGTRAYWSIADTWDADFWAHRHAIIEAVRKRGYKVSSSVNWGVVDYIVTKEVTLK